MKILYITTIGSTMNFFISFIGSLLNEGHTIDIATNENSSSVPIYYRECGCNVYQINTSRSPLSKGNILAIKQIKELVSREKYDIVHCHTPIAAMCTRLACRKIRKQGTKVFYTAHGFHFYKGAPLLNWLIYYPVEKICSYFTDVLITINKEDYNFAKKRLNAKSVCYVPGVGIDTEKFSFDSSARSEKRNELGLSDDNILIMSVGELNENKNHQVVIKALAKLSNKNIHYAIAGKGEKHDFLINLANELGVSERVHLLGYRTDIDKLYSAADICCIPSIREGLVVAALEGMSCGVPLVSSKCRGTVDYAVDGENAFLCNWNSSDEFAHAIDKLAKDKALREKLSIESVQIAQRFDKSVISKIMNDIYNK